MVERFTVSEDGSRLDYALTVIDPANFTEPVTLTKFWAWYPQMTVEPFDCELREGQATENRCRCAEGPGGSHRSAPPCPMADQGFLRK